MGEYQLLYDTINAMDKKMLQLIKLSATRWLAWYQAVLRILQQWIALKLLFQTRKGK